MTIDSKIAVAVRGELGDPEVGLKIAKSMLFGDVTLHFVQETNAWPSSVYAVAETPQKSFVVSESITSFENFLRIARPTLKPVEQFCDLFNEIWKARRLVLSAKTAYLSPMISAAWHFPTEENESIVFFCNNSLTGRCERIEIDNDYHVSVEEAGDGMEWRDA